MNKKIIYIVSLIVFFILTVELITSMLTAKDTLINLLTFPVMGLIAIVAIKLYNNFKKIKS